MATVEERVKNVTAKVLGLEPGNFDILISSEFMDDICWTADGSEVTLIKRFQKS